MIQNTLIFLQPETKTALKSIYIVESVKVQSIQKLSLNNNKVHEVMKFK